MRAHLHPYLIAVVGWLATGCAWLWLGACQIIPAQTEELASVEPRSARCEALADRKLAQCPRQYSQRLASVLECEEDRADYEPQGCGEAFARYVRCQSDAFYSCETGEPRGCADERAELQRCLSSFVARTGCTASPQDHRCDGRQAAYAYSCLTTMPEGCEASDAMYIACCPSFAPETESFFRDPVLDPDELPPDYSDVDFADSTRCLAFNEEQGWGSCERSSGCACTHCAAELAACAADYACLFIRNCDRDTGTCDPSMDPFFTGYGAGDDLADELTACMEAEHCDSGC